ncbi:MAG TPA: glycosyltransferase [Thermoplasmata archaeon]|nr:glycosyltransferase [Thermoplasmata archaeon]
MEVAFYTDSYEPVRDGVATVTGGLAREMARLGHGVRIFTNQPFAGAPTTQQEVEGLSVTRVRSVPVPLYGQYRWPMFPFGLLREMHGAEDVDVIHLHTPGPIGSMGFLSARRYRRPLVGTFHTNIKEMRGSVPAKFLVPFFFRVAWWYNLGTYYRCDVTTTPSEAARDALLSEASKPFRRPIEVIPNGIDVTRFRPGLRVPDWRARCGLPDGPLVTFLGRLTVDKGVHRFLDAVAEAARTTDLTAIVGGAGPEEAAVRERLAKDPRLAGRVRYVGPVAEEEKPALLAESDLFVLPSTSDTSSVALLEAMACGAMVIAPSSGGPAEIVEDGLTGRRVPVTDPTALAAAIVELLDRPTERRAIGREAALRVRERASLETMARRFISLYRLLLDERSPRERGTAL